VYLLEVVEEKHDEQIDPADGAKGADFEI